MNPNDDNFDLVDIAEEIHIKKVFTNSEKSIISVIQDQKVNFFDTSNYKEFADNLGDSFNDINICLPLYRSQICLLVGNQGNTVFPYDQVVIYDFSTSKQIASIKLRFDDDTDRVHKLYANCKALFVVLKHKIMLFNILTLSYITTFEDVNGEDNLVSFGATRETHLTPHITVAYVSNLNPKIIKINKVNFDKKTSENSSILYSQHILNTDFDSIQFLSVSSKCKFLAVVCESGEKINIYSLRSYKARKYLWRGYARVIISDVIFDNEDKFLCLLSSKKTFHIYPLLRKYLNPKAKDPNQISNDNEDDDQDYYNYGRRKPNKIKKMFKSIRKEIGRKYKDSFAKYKDEKVLTSSIKFFYFNDKMDLVVYDENGRVLIIKFNKKKGGMCWLHQTKYLEITEF